MSSRFLSRLGKKKIDVPVLFIQATHDAALPPMLAAGMDKHIPNLTKKEVGAAHWILWEKQEEVNEVIRDWFERVVENKKKKISSL